MRLPRAATLTALLLSPAPLAAQAPATGVVIGTVVDSATGAPLARASVGVPGATPLATDEDGRFTLRLPAGLDTLLVRRVGNEPKVVPVRVAAGDTALIQVILGPPVLGLVYVDEVPTERSARLADFERRRATGRGVFFTRADIEARHPLSLVDLVRRVPSLTIMDSMGVKLPVSTRGRKVVMRARNADAQAPCVMRVGLDGQVKEWGFALNSVDPNEVHGIEVYSGPASIPAELGGARADAYCGLVMIWTRAR